MKQTLYIRDYHLAKRAKQLIDELPYEPVHEVIIREAKSKRSGQQNKYLWGVIYETIRQHILDSTGQVYSSEDIHEAMKQKFMPADTVELGEHQISIARTTTKLSVKEFAEYVDKIIWYAAEYLECQIPAPFEEQWYQEAQNKNAAR